MVEGEVLKFSGDTRRMTGNIKFDKSRFVRHCRVADKAGHRACLRSI